MPRRRTTVTPVQKLLARVERGVLIVLATLIGSLLWLATIDLVVTDLVGYNHPIIRRLLMGTLLAASIAAAVVVRRRWVGRRRTRVRHLQELFALTPREFEAAVANLLTDLGYRGMERVGGAGDLSADLRGRDPKGRPAVVQCKRYAPGNRVGSPDVQQFIGMLTVHHRAERGLFVTTTTFTEPAVALAAQHGIELIDGPRLGVLLERVHGNRTTRAGSLGYAPADI